MQIFKKAILFVALAVAAPLPAWAVVGGAGTDVCRSPNQFYTNPETLNSGGNISICPTQVQAAQYEALRLEPGVAGAPLEIYGGCYWLDNHGSNTVFIPISTSAEWHAFLAHKPANIHVQTCCQAKSIQTADTCNQAVTLNYGRSRQEEQGAFGDNGARKVQFVCSGGEWHVAWTNGASCSQNGQVQTISDFRVQGWATERHF